MCAVPRLGYNVCVPPGHSSGVLDPDERRGTQRSDGTGQRGPRGPSRRRAGERRERNARESPSGRTLARTGRPWPVLAAWPHTPSLPVMPPLVGVSGFQQRSFSPKMPLPEPMLLSCGRNTRGLTWARGGGEANRTRADGPCAPRGTRTQREAPLRPQLPPLTPRRVPGQTPQQEAGGGRGRWPAALGPRPLL